MPTLQQRIAEADKLVTSLVALKADQEKVQKAAQETGVHASMAQAMAADTKRLRDETSESLRQINQELIQHERALASIKALLEPLNGRLSELGISISRAESETVTNQRSLANLQLKLAPLLVGIGQAESDLARVQKTIASAPKLEDYVQSATRLVATLEQAITQLDARIKSLPPPAPGPTPPDDCPGSVAALDSLGRERIQRALAAQNIVITIDGKFGTKTSAAIRAYQTKSGDPLTGTLSRAQMCRLWKTQAATQ
jgi:chromosome segregation ATPase